MSYIRRATVVIALAGMLVLASVSAAHAIFPRLQTDLTGPAIDGVVPEGVARLDQSGLPAEPATLDLRIRNVNLADGTVLTVFITDCSSGGVPIPLGDLTLDGGKARGSLTLPAQCQTGHNSSIFLKTADGTVVLEGGSPWEVR